MKSTKIKTMFIRDIYSGDRNAYLAARRNDYCKVQYEWSCYIDTLCKNGVITQKQYDHATF